MLVYKACSRIADIHFCLLWELLLGAGDAIPVCRWILEEVNALCKARRSHAGTASPAFSQIVTVCPGSFMGKSGAASGTESEQGYENLAHAVANGGHSAAYVKPR